MKYLLLACVLACGSAHADDLVITTNGLQTYYYGHLFHVETDGMSGEVILNADAPASYSENDDAGPMKTGAWHVVVRQAGEPDYDTVMNCDVTTASTEGLGRVSMNCVASFNSAALKRR